MGPSKRRRSDRAGRGPIRSPGRPTAGRREDREAFWRAIARGVTSEDAALAVGVSPPVGTRWFRENGGMPPANLGPLSGRYLSFSEREEIAVLRAQRVGVREIARRIGRCPSTISRELRRNAATRTLPSSHEQLLAHLRAFGVVHKPGGGSVVRAPFVALLVSALRVRHDDLARLVTAAARAVFPPPIALPADRQELLAAGAREEPMIEHDLERADFLRWLSSRARVRLSTRPRSTRKAGSCSSWPSSYRARTAPS
jgi:Helix-turn-helix domain